MVSSPVQQWSSRSFNPTFTPCVRRDCASGYNCGRDRHHSSHKYLSAPQLEHDPHPDLLVDHSVLGILVKFLLRVHVDAVGSQFFSDLVREGSNIKPS